MSYEEAQPFQQAAVMFIALFLSRRSQGRRFTWSPAIHVEDASVRSALIPFGMS